MALGMAIRSGARRVRRVTPPPPIARGLDFSSNQNGALIVPMEDF